VTRALAERYLSALGVVALAGASGAGLREVGLDDAVNFVFLLAVVVVAAGFGRGPAVFAAVLGVTAHAFFFVPPVFAFPALADAQAWWTLATLLLVALVVGTLTSRLRRHAAESDSRARWADSLRALSRELARGRGRHAVLSVAAERTGTQFGGRAVVVTTDEAGDLEGRAEDGETPLAPEERALVARVLSERRTVEGAAGPAGSPDSIATPLLSERGVLGALLLRRHTPSAPLSREELDVLEGSARLTAEALERATLAEKAQQAEVEARTERLRNALLSSVSHDFRTPLAVIVAATSHLASRGDSLDAAARADLARTAEQEAERLNRLVNDLLAMTRLDADAVRAAKEWQPLEDVVGAALGRMERVLEGRPVSVSIPPDLPLVPLDAVLVEQVLVNLLDNAAKHTPAGVPVEIRAGSEDDAIVTVEVLDRGPGLAPGEEEAVFDRFRRGAAPGGEGVGLGLAVCRGIVVVHGGRMWAERRPGGGVAFRFTLPLEGAPPVAPPVEDVVAERA
jgi:two-component system sensor histidine kinase KdpD